MNMAAALNKAIEFAQGLSPTNPAAILPTVLPIPTIETSIAESLLDIANPCAMVGRNIMGTKNPENIIIACKRIKMHTMVEVIGFFTFVILHDVKFIKKTAMEKDCDPSEIIM